MRTCERARGGSLPPPLHATWSPCSGRPLVAMRITGKPDEAPMALHANGLHLERTSTAVQMRRRLEVGRRSYVHAREHAVVGLCDI